MKRIYFLFFSLAAITLSSGTLNAQNEVRGSKFDTTLSKKHELSVVFGMSAGRGMLNNFSFGTGRMGGFFGLEYARVYKRKHFLRTGIRAAVGNRGSWRSNNSVDLPPSSGYNFNSLPDNYTMLKTNGTQDLQQNFVGAFVGYEYAIGRKKLRFTFGADLHIGYNRNEISAFESQYQETRTLDTLSGMYSYAIQFQKAGERNGISNNIFLALSPRFGLRRDFNKRIALAAALTPQIGYSQRLGYSETISGDGASNYFSPKGNWFFFANADLRLIIKLGKQ